MKKIKKRGKVYALATKAGLKNVVAKAKRLDEMAQGFKKGQRKEKQKSILDSKTITGKMD